jgi:DNA-binding NarL/FixJ family response regulator
MYDDVNVLLIQSDRRQIEITNKVLSEAGAPLNVHCATGTSEARARLAAGGIDVVLLDLAMPEERPLDNFFQLRAESPNVPVLLLASDEDETLAIAGLREGARDFLVKGQIDSKALIRALHHAVGRPASPVARAARERRGTSRFALELKAGYKVEAAAASAKTTKTLNMSSRGILFTTDESLPPGKIVQVAVEWPAQSKDSRPQKLLAQGPVVRCERGKAAIAIQKYDFKPEEPGGNPPVRS